MATYHVLYLRLSDAQVDEVNKTGWSCPVGHAYLGMTTFGTPGGIPAALEYGLYEHAGDVQALDNEMVFAIMQNDLQPWRENPRVSAVHTNFPRSMSVGDLVHEPETGMWHLCASLGFEPVPVALHERLKSLLKKEGTV